LSRPRRLQHQDWPAKSLGSRPSRLQLHILAAILTAASFQKKEYSSVAKLMKYGAFLVLVVEELAEQHENVTYWYDDNLKYSNTMR
jgi:hypothetical protein